MESRIRSWAKSATRRVIGIIILGGISYLMTRNWEQTTIITAVFHTLRFVLYYYHERIWERVTWGRETHPLSYLSVKKEMGKEDYEAIERLLRDRDCLARPDYEI